MHTQDCKLRCGIVKKRREHGYMGKNIPYIDIKNGTTQNTSDHIFTVFQSP